MPLARISHTPGVTHTSADAWSAVATANAGAVIEVPVGGAVAQFRWTFEDLCGRTRITQRISIGGEGAVSLVNVIAPIFESSVPGGMQKLCEVMAREAARQKRE